jgi:hypothetical protein
MSHFDFAQVCPNGHVAASLLTSFPGYRREYCEHCGEKTLTRCARCQTPIRGDSLSNPGVYVPPAYCYHCGSAHPWTERRIQAAIELVAEELSPEDAGHFAESVKTVARDTPQAEVAANRLRKLLLKLPSYLADATRKLIIDIASETAAKILTQQITGPPAP